MISQKTPKAAPYQIYARPLPADRVACLNIYKDKGNE